MAEFKYRGVLKPGEFTVFQLDPACGHPRSFFRRIPPRFLKHLVQTSVTQHHLDDFISPSFCVAAYLKALGFNKKVYVLGSQGTTDELDSVGIRYLPIGRDPVDEDWVKALYELKLDAEVGAVVVGFDQYISYPKLTKAASYLRRPEVLFLSTNMDTQEQFPTKSDIACPGPGTFVTAVELVSGRASTCVGKPYKYMLDCVKLVHPEIEFSRCLMIGDTLHTDILLGTKHGLKTLLVGTGVNSIEDVRGYEANEKDQLLVPDYYLPCLGDMKQYVEVKMLVKAQQKRVVTASSPGKTYAFPVRARNGFKGKLTGGSEVQR